MLLDARQADNQSVMDMSRLQPDPDGVAEARALIAASRRMVAFTGAGISTESGVPDFRSPGSPWLANRPIPFDQFMASRDARAEAWRRKFVMDDLYAHAAPSRGHRALANLAAAGRLQAVITQNIDGLHQASGLGDRDVIELHGNGSYAACLACGLRCELADVRRRFEASGAAPDCEACGGVVKSATISFGQAMPADAMRRAEALACDCDLFLVLGSSLVVFPAATLPIIAKRSGADVVIVNREATKLDSIADIAVLADISTVLAPFV
jgi:NAD-dependent deacetylase